jgi:phosphoglycolate phosphatase-like HAD superfamily hydrolase
MKALIFDFDGTIADSFETLLGIFEEIYPRAQQITPKEIKELRGKTLRQIIKHFKIKSWQIPRLLLKARPLVATRMTTIKTFHGMPAALKQLHKNGHQMFILSTNSSENIAQFLKNSRLEGYFVEIYGDIGLRTKSSALKKIMKQEGIDRGDCAYIGDEVRDIEAAKKAGVMSVAVGWGFNYPEALQKTHPNFLAKSPKDLLKIL